jgi:hypothetical protein
MQDNMPEHVAEFLFSWSMKSGDIEHSLTFSITTLIIMSKIQHSSRQLNISVDTPSASYAMSRYVKCHGTWWRYKCSLKDPRPQSTSCGFIFSEIKQNGTPDRRTRAGEPCDADVGVATCTDDVRRRLCRRRNGRRRSHRRRSVRRNICVVGTRQSKRKTV